MHPDLQDAVNLHEAIVREAGKALIGYDNDAQSQGAAMVIYRGGEGG